jgi:catechol 2,3-dioxygenase-like lactoylglutathione lyase family enzyme
MVQTHGLTHINLAVRDLGRALRFYEQVFGLREYGRGDGLVNTQAPGRHDIVTFAEDPTTAGLSGGIAHFGFRLVDPGDIDRAIAEVEHAKDRAIDYAETRACFRSGEIRVLDSSGNVERTIAFSEAGRKL